MGLHSLKYCYSYGLSGGQQQRGAIARALIESPDIILADEPMRDLDSITTDEIMEVLKMSLKKYKQTIIMATHDKKCAKNADRIVYLKDGQIL